MRKNQNSIENCKHCNLSLNDLSVQKIYTVQGFCCGECFIADQLKFTSPDLVRPMLQLFGREIGNFIHFDTHSYEELISRAIYKATQCGAWLKIINPQTIVLGAIVEGCDFGTEIYTLVWPFSATEFWETLDEIEGEAAYMWDQTHGCECCHTEGEWGHGAIGPLCKNCKGHGAVI